MMFKRRHNTVMYSREDTNAVICPREDTVSGLGIVQEKTQYSDMFEGRHNIFEGRHNTVTSSREDTVLKLSNVQEKTQYREMFERRHNIRTWYCSREDTITWHVRGKTRYRDTLERRHSIGTQ